MLYEAHQWAEFPYEESVHVLSGWDEWEIEVRCEAFALCAGVTGSAICLQDVSLSPSLP